MGGREVGHLAAFEAAVVVLHLDRGGSVWVGFFGTGRTGC